MRLWWRRVGLGEGGGAEGAAVEALQVKFYTMRLTLLRPTVTSSSSPRVGVEVPPTQFFFGVADVPVVQSIELAPGTVS